MRLFLDSADAREIARFSRWGIIDGITTTPTFFRRLGIHDMYKACEELASQFKGEIHLEAMGSRVSDIIDAARRNRELGENIVSKIPIGEAGIEAAFRLSQEDIRVNLHLVFNVNQAVLGAKAKAAYVCPLMGRLNDAGLNGCDIVADIQRALALHDDLRCEVMVSSIRNGEDARLAFLTGAGAVTIPGAVLSGILQNPLTDKALRILNTDVVLGDAVSAHMRTLSALPTLPSTASVQRAMVEMSLKKIGIAAVVDGTLLEGVVTDGDLRRALERSGAETDLALKEIMNRAPKCVRLDDRVNTAVELMRTHRTTEIIVVDTEGRPLGLVNIHDVMASASLG